MFGAHEVMYLVDNKQATDGLQIETHNIAIQSISVQGTVDLRSYIMPIDRCLPFTYALKDISRLLLSIFTIKNTQK